MRCTQLGSAFNVAVGEADIQAFNRSWPGSNLRGLRGVTFQFDARSGDLIDIWYRNGDADRWDGPALAALSEDAQQYGYHRIQSETRKVIPNEESTQALRQRLQYLRADYRVWAQTEGRLTRSEFAEKMRLERQIEAIERKLAARG
jgi:hypothetical protein